MRQYVLTHVFQFLKISRGDIRTPGRVEAVHLLDLALAMSAAAWVETPRQKLRTNIALTLTLTLTLALTLTLTLLYSFFIFFVLFYFCLYLAIQLLAASVF